MHIQTIFNNFIRKNFVRKMPQLNYTLNIIEQRAYKGHVKIALRSLKGVDKKEKGFFSIPVNHWDIENKSIKKKYTEMYIDTIKELNEIKARIPAYLIRLNKGEISDENALIEIIGRQKRLDGTLLDYADTLSPKRYSQKYKLTEGKIKRMKQRINALQNKTLEGTKYFPLTFEMLQSETNVKNIAELMYESSLSDDTISKYMTSVDRMCWLKKSKWTPFKQYELISYKKKVTRQYALSFREIESALNKVETLQDLEAYLFWLYSFCLLGLNFRDIINIDENKVMQFGETGYKEQKTYHPYHPEMQNTKDPLHVFIYRGKLSSEDRNKAPIVRMINLHPIWVINKMLRHIVKLTRPEYAYTGRDKLRIFNFYTRDENYNEIQSGIDKSERIRSTYYKKWIQILGYPIKHTRATSMKAGRLAGASFDELEAQLGHVLGVSKTFPTYYSAEQKKVDTNHIFSLMKYDINKVLLYTIRRFKDMVTKDKYWIEENVRLEVVRNFTGSGFDLPLSLLTPSEYTEMQELLMAQEDTSTQDEYGKVIYHKANPDNYPERLKNLLEKQQKLQFIHLYGAETMDDFDKFIESELNI